MATRARGTAPGAGYVREMFTRIAPRYDLLNHLLSFNIDRLWRGRVARRFGAVLSRPGARVLDLCCGTGDLALALGGKGAARKFERAGMPVLLAEADALRLPFPDASFDLVTSAFGFRNLADYEAGLREMLRLLRPGGQIGVLEFAEPPGRFLGALYGFYFRHVLPKVGGAISGDSGAYAYLPASVERFPSPEELAGWMREAGFQEVEFQRFTGGVACLHTGRR
jgi:demethylmenaquinone methyltransferase/2-methoxy-6-polyprenyl-1,4-benzoquinol methylase